MAASAASVVFTSDFWNNSLCPAASNNNGTMVPSAITTTTFPSFNVSLSNEATLDFSESWTLLAAAAIVSAFCLLLTFAMCLMIGLRKRKDAVHDNDDEVDEAYDHEDDDDQHQQQVTVVQHDEVGQEGNENDDDVGDGDSDEEEMDDRRKNYRR